MEEFRRSYSRLCKDSGAEPQEAVLKQLHDLREGHRKNKLDLATQSLSVDTCGALGKLLQNDILFSMVLLSDCMMSEEGSKLLIQGLCSNTVVKYLDLKGNNLRAMGAEALGKLLRQNKSIQSLILEWNNLGMWEESFSLFCEGLRANTTLQQLDLRNNQINHKGAEELAMALKNNSTLQDIDLRWNNIGLLGGRAIVNCLSNNKTLRKLELAGNNIPGDVLKAVEQAMDHNLDRQVSLQENQNRTYVLSKEVQNLKEEKSKQFLNLMDTIDKQREEISRNCRTSAVRVSQLQEALNERHSIINSLKAKLQMSEAALALSEQKVQDLSELLTTAQKEQINLSQRQSKELQLEQQVYWTRDSVMIQGKIGQQEAADRESKLLKEVASSNERNMLLRSQVDELERKSKTQQERLFLTKQELTNITSELKLRLTQAEERLEMEKRRFKQSLEDSENLRLKEVEHLTRRMEESERSLQERIQKLETVRISLEEEVNRVKKAILAERSQAEEEMIKAKSQVRLEMQQRVTHLEEKIRLISQARDEAQEYCLQQKQAVTESQTKNNQMGLQMEAVRRQLEELQKEVRDKEQEKVAEVNKVRVELQEQIGHLQAERTAQEGLKEKIAALERQIKVMSSSHREALLDKESENASIREKLRLKSAEINRLREEEAQRASFLQNAILAYVQGSPLGTPKPDK
ncbi:leucine-rich repeat-containing protein 45 isoform X1 [Sarcophilus harrisii]|uniref:leucine-rich repeat-containing protein 45 isoform X1 n=1 Tax=Sarcophilus harrisii TaxID=9305 RepID=UPI001301E54C|nr:leucine-rich repeat-containing protein 45 isoform X1 [Sarcophilus harrisii]